MQHPCKYENVALCTKEVCQYKAIVALYHRAFAVLLHITPVKKEGMNRTVFLTSVSLHTQHETVCIQTRKKIMICGVSSRENRKIDVDEVEKVSGTIPSKQAKQ